MLNGSRVQTVMFFNFGSEAYFPEILCEFFQSLHTNAGMISQIRFLEAQHKLENEYHFNEPFAGIQISKVM
jgi:hypothetical protein